MLNGKGVDERRSPFKAMREKELELITTLGGDPSPQQQAIIANTVKNMLYIASLDNYLMGLKSLVRKGKPHPVLAIRTRLSAHLRENLKTLGLRRVSRRSPLPCAIKSLTSSSGQSDTCQNPFCKSIIEALPDRWRMTKRRYCSNRCKLDDGYALRRAEALLNCVGIVRFHDLLDQA